VTDDLSDPTAAPVAGLAALDPPTNCTIPDRRPDRATRALPCTSDVSAQDTDARTAHPERAA